MKFVAFLIIPFLLFAEPPIKTTADTTLFDLPQEKQEQFAVHIPDYEGVEQLIVLNNRWVVVVTTPLEEIIRRFDELTDGEFSKHYEIWKESEEKGSPNWSSREYVMQKREELLEDARKHIGELDLDNISYYEITTPDGDSQRPLRITKNIVSLGGNGNPFEMEVIHWANYVYLEFPFPMENGKSYTISLADGKRVTFLYDEKRTISRAIKVNQAGYLIGKMKYAYLGGFLYEFGPLDFPEAKEFTVINVKTGEEALKGEIKLREENFATSGENLYELDLSNLDQEGEFFITIPTVGRSWTFRNAPDAFGEPFYTITRGMYHQRSGMEVSRNHSGWPREAGHTEPVYESEHVTFYPPIKGPDGYEPFDVIGATIDYLKPTEDASGGWYDAADWDKQLTHYANVFNMLNVFEFDPDKFTDGQLNLPESGNGIPDLLDEVEWGLLVWKKSMTEEGGVAGSVETWTHPSMHATDVNYAYSQRTRWNSLIYAAAAAQFSRLVAPYDSEKAEEYAESARKAYGFGINPENSLGEIEIHAKRDRGKGEPYTFTFREKEEELTPFKIHARLQMFLLDLDEKHLEGVEELLTDAPKPYEWPLSDADFSPWFYYALFSDEVSPHISPAIIDKWRKNFIEPADELLELSNKHPYRHSWPVGRDYWMNWGATVMTNQAKVLLIAHHMTKDDQYLNAALQNIDFMLGNNPMGMSWVTGIGFVYPIDIQHENSERDHIMDPIPGIPIYGMTGEIIPVFKEKVWNTGDTQFLKEENRNVPLWRRFVAHPHINVYQNEFTIHETTASAIFCYAYLLSNDWMPSPSLKERGPRKDQFLFGYWYLP